ncbi:MAG TPA: T9SS type A sorting domain-containing protein [Bacteroidia bacterium]|nr:T9SS type A sorting domain-containing protein [Bacteroidia bacterium]
MKKICTIILTILTFPFEIYSQNGLTAYPVPAATGAGQSRYRNDLKVDAADNVWVAFRDIGLGKFDGANWTVYNNSNSSFPDSTVYAIAFDNMSNVWAGTNHGLAKYNGATWSVFNTGNSQLPNDTVKALAVTGNNLWIGTNYGALEYDGNTWTIFNTSNSGIISDTINAFTFGSNGEAWIGTYRGLSKFYQGNWTNYDSLNSGLADQNVLSLAVDNNNDIWIGSFPFSVFKMENGIVKDYAAEIYNGTVPFGDYSPYSLIKNSQGNIVASHLTGVTEITDQVVNIYWMGKGIGIYGLFGNKNDFDSSGKLWIVTRRASPTAFSGGDSIFSFDFSQHANYGFGLTNYNFKFLDINDVNASMMDFGMMHWDMGPVGWPQYFVPKNSGKTSVFASSLWIGGMDVSGNLHLAAQTYRQTGTDYWPGPVDTVTGIADSMSTRPYDKIWKVNRFDVEDFKYNFLLGNVGNGSYQIPTDILTWPAIGTGNISRNLAPYVDYNGDGNYDPFDGDYPKIKGDQMLYWIFNDNLSYHTNTNADPLGFEIQTSAYSYTCPSLPDSNFTMNWTTFYNYKIINRSSTAYHDIYLGLFSDTDLGWYKDDYIGCDSILDAGFTYNGDAVDDLPGGYGANPPMQNIVILKGPLADAGDGLDNNHNGIIDEPGERCSMNHFHYYNNSNDPNIGEPDSANDYYNYLKSVWKDGTHVTYGGNGYLGTIPTNYFFSGTPYSGTGWSEQTVLNVVDDRRMLLSSGPFSLAPGQETTIDFAYVFTWDSTAANGLTTSIARNIADLQRIKHWFDIDSFPSCLILNVGVNQMEEKNNSLNIYPNPANDKLYVESSSNGVSESFYEVIDLPGRILMNEKSKSNFIDIRQLPKGLYILQWHNGDKTYRKKFVKE